MPYAWILASLFAVITVAYALWFFVPVIKFRFLDRMGNQPVSVVVSAHNEAENLKKLIPALFDQQHPDFQVVIINDRSTDHTAEVLWDFRQTYGDKLHVVDVPPQEWKSFRGNKKFALTLGIKAARHDRLLLTDADCLPASARWISRMTAPLDDENIQFVLGYGRYRKRAGLLNSIIRYETLQTMAQYAGHALRGMPYMGVGRNLAYRKSFFLENNGFDRHFHLLSGDDDLLVNRLATKTNTAVCLHPEAHTLSEPKVRFGEWIRQKRRHLSASAHYRLRDKILLGIFSGSLAGFWFFWLWWAAMAWNTPWPWGVFALRAGISHGLLWKTGRKLGDAVALFLMPLVEVLWVLSQGFIVLRNMISKPQTWH